MAQIGSHLKIIGQNGTEMKHKSLSTIAHQEVAVDTVQATQNKFTIHMIQGIGNVIDLNRFNSFKKLLRITAYVRRFITNCRKRAIHTGFIDSTDIYMTGEIDISKVTLGCYSCRPPHGYNVEFLVNGRSEDSLTLNYETGKCTHRIGECKPDLCSCSPSGNEFLRSFYSQETNKTATFSCNMVFVDVIADSRFSKYKTLFYDGTEIHPMDTITDIEYSSAENNGNKDKTKDNNEAECEDTMILRPHRNEEITPLCLNTAPPCDELQSSKDEQVPQMNRQVEECVIRKQDEQVPQMNRQVDECVIRKEGNERSNNLERRLKYRR
ncbi:Hypothetical predicted protein [Mytilus galloprovincialis]|uniref:Uncharacterized protein n=1 Tax=Mytilus galloprovincialis TaxID=29158 RepID=A0A8B6C6Q9_MYTGA|nr:Hypothetical predicted protein [Mytilus galloprovincialis]